MARGLKQYTGNHCQHGHRWSASSTTKQSSPQPTSKMYKPFKVKFMKAMHSLNMESFTQEVLSSRRAQSDDDDDASGTETINSLDD